jgi:hypothetical protein
LPQDALKKKNRFSSFSQQSHIAATLSSITSAQQASVSTRDHYHKVGIETSSMSSAFNSTSLHSDTFPDSNAGLTFVVRGKAIIMTSPGRSVASQTLNPHTFDHKDSATNKASHHTTQRSERMWVPHPFDVLYGRNSKKYSGNQFFASLLVQNMEEYAQAHDTKDRNLKNDIADKVVANVMSRGGQFLGPLQSNSLSPPVLSQDKQLEKVHHCMLRRITRMRKKRSVSTLSDNNSHDAMTSSCSSKKILHCRSQQGNPSPKKRQRTASTEFHAAAQAGTKEESTSNAPDTNVEIGKRLTNYLAESTDSSETTSDPSMSSRQADAEDALSVAFPGNNASELPSTPTNWMTSSSTMSTLSSVASVNPDDDTSREMMNGLLLSPPPAPLKASKSWRAASSPPKTSTYNLAKVNCFGQLQAGLHPTSSGNSRSSFTSAPRSRITNPSFHESIVGGSPGFMESPIGWPSLAGAIALPGSGGASCVAYSLMNGRMIESPGLGLYPSPSATLRRVSDATQSALQQQQQQRQQQPDKFQFRRDATTPVYYHLGQSQSFAYSCLDGAIEESLSSLRVNLSSMYSEVSPQLQTKEKTSAKQPLEKVLLQHDRSMYEATNTTAGMSSSKPASSPSFAPKRVHHQL